MGICKESGVEIHHTVIDWTNRIDELCVNKNHLRASLFDFLLFTTDSIVSRAKENMKNHVFKKERIAIIYLFLQTNMSVISTS